jgi:predicted nucleic acid-binding protein
MNIIIDSNILFSALIKDSLTRKIILKSKEEFLFPLYIFEEMQKHEEELIRKSGLSTKEFYDLLNALLQKVRFIETENLQDYREKVFDIIKDIDVNDIIFIASALAHSDSLIWSDDKKLKLQSQVRVLNTSEIIKLLAVD